MRLGLDAGAGLAFPNTNIQPLNRPQLYATIGDTCAGWAGSISGWVALLHRSEEFRESDQTVAIGIEFGEDFLHQCHILVDHARQVVEFLIGECTVLVNVGFRETGGTAFVDHIAQPQPGLITFLIADLAVAIGIPVRTESLADLVACLDHGLLFFCVDDAVTIDVVWGKVCWQAGTGTEAFLLLWSRLCEHGRGEAEGADYKPIDFHFFVLS